jgi:hypothetical protein
MPLHRTTKSFEDGNCSTHLYTSRKLAHRRPSLWAVLIAVWSYRGLQISSVSIQCWIYDTQMVILRADVVISGLRYAFNNFFLYPQFKNLLQLNLSSLFSKWLGLYPHARLLDGIIDPFDMMLIKSHRIKFALETNAAVYCDGYWCDFRLRISSLSHDLCFL